MNRIFSIFVFVIFISSCTKFEDGPKYSLYSKTKRILRTWKIEYKIDLATGEKYTSDYDGWTFALFEDNKYTKNYFYNKEKFSEQGEWKFQQDTLVLTYAPKNISITRHYKILRLTRKEMWLKDSLEETHYVELNHIP